MLSEPVLNEVTDLQAESLFFPGVHSAALSQMEALPECCSYQEARAQEKDRGGFGDDGDVSRVRDRNVTN